MQYSQPQCYKCKFFKSAPKGIGGKAVCSVYQNGIPKKIFFEGSRCGKSITPKKTTTKKPTRTTKRK